MIDIEPLLNGSAGTDWISDTAAGLVSNASFSLLELVTSLGPVLTHTTTQVRVAGVGLLSSVLDHPATVAKLNKQELDVIFTFYIDRSVLEEILLLN